MRTSFAYNSTDRQTEKSKNENENAHTQLNEMKLPRIRKYSENKVNAHFSFVEIPVNSDDALEYMRSQISIGRHQGTGTTNCRFSTSTIHLRAGAR